MPIRLSIFITPLMLACVILSGGCNIVGPVAAAVAPPPTVAAEYTLQDRPTVVFIDDRENVVNPISFRRVIADKVSEDLMTKKILSRTIRPHDALAVASHYDRSNQVMPIDAIGRAVGAEQVLYIEMVAFVDHIDRNTPRGYASARVRVIDVENRKRLYPPEDADVPYRQIDVMTGEMKPEAYHTRATRMQVFDTLAKETGSTVAKLFYKHEQRELGGRLGGR